MDLGDWDPAEDGAPMLFRKAALQQFAKEWQEFSSAGTGVRQDGGPPLPTAVIEGGVPAAGATGGDKDASSRAHIFFGKTSVLLEKRGNDGGVALNTRSRPFKEFVREEKNRAAKSGAAAPSTKKAQKAGTSGDAGSSPEAEGATPEIGTQVHPYVFNKAVETGKTVAGLSRDALARLVKNFLYYTGLDGGGAGKTEVENKAGEKKEVEKKSGKEENGAGEKKKEVENKG